ncbi:major facilitator superfamily-like protein [Aureococcus anophagefferens]|nr:major facilitator superfamily-like protein [Aureococcus anophagefferens]
MRLRRKDKVALEVIDAEPPDPAMDAEVVLATHAAAAATLKAASCGADLAVAELAPGDRICWAAVVTGAHVFALRYLVGDDAAARRARPVLLVALVATVISLVRARAPAPIRGAGRGGFLDTVWLGGYEAQMDEPPFPSLDVLDAQKALARSRRASTLQSVTVKAVPGSSTRKAAVAGDVGTWEPSVASRFVLRGPDYLRDKKKFPSAEELYEPFALDNMFFPGEPPALFGGPPKPEEREREGAPKGWQVVCWWRVTEEAARIIKERPREDWPPHLGLWQYYANNAETMSVLNGAFKGVARVDNIGDASLGLPRLLHQFNAKPVLMAAAALVGERPGSCRSPEASSPACASTTSTSTTRPTWAWLAADL